MTRFCQKTLWSYYINVLCNAQSAPIETSKMGLFAKTVYSSKMFINFKNFTCKVGSKFDHVSYTIFFMLCLDSEFVWLRKIQAVSPNFLVGTFSVNGQFSQIFGRIVFQWKLPHQIIRRKSLYFTLYHYKYKHILWYKL